MAILPNSPRLSMTGRSCISCALPALGGLLSVSTWQLFFMARAPRDLNAAHYFECQHGVLTPMRSGGKARLLRRWLLVTCNIPTDAPVARYGGSLQFGRQSNKKRNTKTRRFELLPVKTHVWIPTVRASDFSRWWLLWFLYVVWACGLGPAAAQAVRAWVHPKS